MGEDRLAVVGSFTAPTERFAVLEPSGELGAGFALAEPPSKRVRAVLPLPDGSYLIGGDFTNVGARLARYSASGALDPSLTLAANNDVNSLAADGDGAVLLGGLFTTINGVPRRRIARLKPDLTPDEGFRTDGFDDEVHTVVVHASDVLTGGNFYLPHRLAMRVFGHGDPPSDALELIRAPLSRQAVAGSAIDLTVAVAPVRSGLEYEWSHDGEVISVSSNPMLNVDRITPEQSGIYQVEVSDDTGESTKSPPIRVDVTHRLPGRESEFRYRGESIEISPSALVDATVSVPDSFLIRNVRVSVDLLHPDTSDLVLCLISPDGTQVKLFGNSGRRGLDLRHTSFDDEVGSDREVDKAQPPYTGTFYPDSSLAPMRGKSSAGTWTLRVKNSAAGAGELLDWNLELRAEAVPVSYPSFLALRGADDSAENRAAYAVPRPVEGSAAASIPIPGQLGGFSMVHWRWSEPLDLNYSYQRSDLRTWLPAEPIKSKITRFPGGIERCEVEFSSAKSAEFFRVLTGFGG